MNEPLPVTRLPEASAGLQLATAPLVARHSHLAPTPYQVVARWEYRQAGEVRRTIITRHITVSSEPLGPYRLVTLVATPPELRQPELTALEEITVRLGALYQRLVLRVSPTGQLLELLNHAEILETWAAVEQEINNRFADGPDELLAMLLAEVNQQVQSTDALLASLQYDYVYGFLLKNFLRQDGEETEQEFPHFFADTTLVFREQHLPRPAPAAGRVARHLQGILDETRTSRAAVAEQVATELAPEADPTPPPPPTDSLMFAYTADYVLDADTGWPESVEAVINCQSPAGYAKEYDLTIQHL